MQYQLGKTVISLTQGDITLETTDAIANAANRQLKGGGGVDGAIHRAAGPELMAACRAIGGCSTGQSVITRGFRLQSPYVIHTVGPIYSGCADDAYLLASCYSTSLELALIHKLRSIAFPSISTGVYGYPLDEAAPVALQTICRFVTVHPQAFELVRMVLFDKQSYGAYAKAVQAIFAATPVH